MAGKQYRYMGHHATELETGDTRPWVGPGDLVELSAEDVNTDRMKEMIEEGTLVDVAALVEEVEKAEQEATKAAEAEAKTAQEGAEEATATASDAAKKGGK